jgi:choline dehydrogenase
LAGATGFINHGMDRPPAPVFTSLAALIQPTSRGLLELRCSDPTMAPRLDPAYYPGSQDLATMKAGLQALLEIAKHQPLAGFLLEPYLPGRADPDDATLTDHVRRWTQTEYHPVGTCKMGTGAEAVVDPQLRVHGLQGLRIVDASIMPTITRANTNAPTIMIAEKAADLIRQR